MISHNGWNIAYLKMLRSVLFVDASEVWSVVRINNSLKMDFEHGVKPLARLEHSLKHLRSRMHILSTERYANYKTSVPVNEQLGDQMKAEKSKKEKERAENREVVTIIMDCLMFLAKQGLAFRGHSESSESSNRGNFIELVYFLSTYNPQLKTWLDKHPGNVTYLSADIQNEMLNIAAEKIRSKISAEVCQAG